MAINLVTRPREFIQNSTGSPSVALYSNWIASGKFDSCVYGFSIADSDDVLSRISVQLYEAGSNTLLASFYVRPFRTGTYYLDVLPYVAPYLNTEYDADFGSEKNCADEEAQIRFYMIWQQIYDDGTTGNLLSEINFTVTVAKAAKQFNVDSYKSNLINYVPIPDTRDSKAKFLTEFTQPVMFVGYEFTLNFIYDNGISGRVIECEETELNINRSDLSVTTTELDQSHVRKINHLKIDEPSNLQTHYIDVKLQTGDESEEFYVDEGYVDEGYVDIL